jgi:hypothetical protein
MSTGAYITAHMLTTIGQTHCRVATGAPWRRTWFTVKLMDERSDYSRVSKRDNSDRRVHELEDGMGARTRCGELNQHPPLRLYRSRASASASWLVQIRINRILAAEANVFCCIAYIRRTVILHSPPLLICTSHKARKCLVAVLHPMELIRPLAVATAFVQPSDDKTLDAECVRLLYAMYGRAWDCKLPASSREGEGERRRR